MSIDFRSVQQWGFGGYAPPIFEIGIRLYIFASWKEMYKSLTFY